MSLQGPIRITSPPGSFSNRCKRASQSARIDSASRACGALVLGWLSVATAAGVVPNGGHWAEEVKLLVPGSQEVQMKHICVV